MNECLNCETTVLPKIVNNTITAEDPIVAVDSDTINFTVSGADAHTITGVVNVSTTAGNILSSNSTGLFVPANTPITPTDTDSIDITVSGTDNHTISAVTKISATAGNTITINADGLYVPPTTAITTGDLLADNTATITDGTDKLVAGDATVSVPLRITTSGTAVSLPTTTGGYQIQSADSSITITNPSAGVIDFAEKKFYFADLATTGDITATVRTDSSFTQYITPFTTNRIHILSTVGAVNGDEMTVAIAYEGAEILPSTFKLEVRNGTAGGIILDTFTENSIEGHYKFSGSEGRWRKVR